MHQENQSAAKHSGQLIKTCEMDSATENGVDPQDIKQWGAKLKAQCGTDASASSWDSDLDSPGVGFTLLLLF